MSCKWRSRVFIPNVSTKQKDTVGFRDAELRSRIEKAVEKSSPRLTITSIVRVALEQYLDQIEKRQDNDNESSRLTLSQTANPSLAPRISKRKASAA
jgi:hypothetical protein